jgi:hypothetical protein
MTKYSFEPRQCGIDLVKLMQYWCLFGVNPFYLNFQEDNQDKGVLEN